MRYSLTLFLSVLSFVTTSTHAMTTSPAMLHVEQSDGTVIRIRDNGDEKDNWLSDADDFTIEYDEESGDYVYVDLDEVSGNLIRTSDRVGRDVRPKNLRKRLRARNRDCRRQICGSPENTNTNSNEAENIELRRSLEGGRRLEQPAVGTLNNLVVLLHFKDHFETEGRSVPSENDIAELFNGDELTSLAPTGSIKHYFSEVSHGQLTVESTITDWFVTPETERYYADRNYGRTVVLQEAIRAALDHLEQQQFNFKDFDKDGDGVIDAFTILHSGYGAEIFGDDCYGQTRRNRIWSHQWNFWAYDDSSSTWFVDPWVSANTQVSIDKYHVSPSKWSVCGEEIGRIGVIAHETGHYLGVPDLYDPDTSAGGGLGNFDIMANSWGWDFSQHYPGTFSAWSKLQLGWATAVSPVNGQNQVAEWDMTQQASADAHFIYKIGDGQHGFPAGEYLLIENRQAIGFDKLLEGPGLAIFHIDESKSGDLFYNAGEEEGYPGQTNRRGVAWPKNGNHYHTALLPADGDYALEQGQNKGDSTDLFHEDNVAELLPSTISLTDGPFPNTDSYMNGNLAQTGVSITNIGVSRAIMTFDFDDGTVDEEPTCSRLDGVCGANSDCCGRLRCNSRRGVCVQRTTARALRGGLLNDDEEE